MKPKKEYIPSKSFVCLYDVGFGWGWWGLRELDRAATAGPGMSRRQWSRTGTAGILSRAQQAPRTEGLSDRHLPVRPEEEAADQPPQLGRDVEPVPNPVAGQQHHPDVVADPRVEENVPTRRPGRHGIVDEPARGRAAVGRACPQKASQLSGTALTTGHSLAQLSSLSSSVSGPSSLKLRGRSSSQVSADKSDPTPV